jgi:hypothetical protein
MGGTTVTTPPPDMVQPQQPPDATDQIPQQGPQYVSPQMQPGQPPQAPPQGPPPQGPSPSDIENYAAAVHHSRLANAINAATDFLGGSKSLRLVKNADGSVDVQEGPSTPGEKWGRIAKAALQGAATGFAVGQGPGGPQRAAAASIQQGMAMPQQQQDQTLATAEKANDQNMKRQLFNANMAKMHQDLTKATFDNMASKVKFNQDQVQGAIALQDQITKMGGTMAAEYTTPEELAAHVNSNGQLVDAHLGKNGMLIPVNTYDDQGHVTGAKVYVIPEDNRYKLNTSAQKIPFTKINNDGTTTTTYTEVPKGMMTGEQLTGAQLGGMTQMNEAVRQGGQLAAQIAEAAAGTKRADTEASLAPSKIAEQYASAGQAGAEAHKANVEAELAPQALAQKNQANQATLNMIENKYVQPAREAEKSWQLADQTYNEYQQLHAKGKDFPTGAESMLMLSRHLQTTFGNVKGARITKDMIAEHFGARSVSDDVVTAVQKLYNGDRLAPSQWKAFHSLIGQSRNAAWQEVADAGQSRGVDATHYLPPDLGGPPRKITIPPNPGQPMPGPAAVPPPGNISQAARAPGAPPPPPKFGDVVQGHKYIGAPGSNPGDPNNWQALPGGGQ